MQAIGNYLREVREKRGYSQSDVENGTKIPSRYIRAIESGDFSLLPGRAYTIGFIRTYAKFLQVDSDELISYYKEQSGVEETSTVYKNYNEDNNAPRRPVQMSYNKSGRQLDLKRVVIFAAIIVVVIIALAVALGGNGETEPAPENGNTVVNSADDSTDTSTDETNGDAEDNAADGEDTVATTTLPLNVTIMASKGDCDITVESDVDTEGMNISLAQGQQITFEANTFVKVFYSNAGAVDVEVNGQAFESPGSEGEQNTIEYNINQL